MDICIGYKPFISKAVGNVFIKIAYQLIELNQKGYHWQNLEKFEKCDSLWILMCLPTGGVLRVGTTPGAWNVDALICNQHGAEILEIQKWGTTT